jgi:DDE family transposase
MELAALGRSVAEAYRWVPDPRAARGRRHPLPAILALATAAMLEGAQSLYAIHQWGRLQPPAVLAALGFTREQTPSISTLHDVLARIDAAVLEEVLAAWAQAAAGAEVEAIAVDGKAVRGSHGRSATGVAVDLVAAYAHGAGQVLAQAGGRGR